MADDVDFKIFGDDMQTVEIELDPGEAVRAETGAMMYMVMVVVLLVRPQGLLGIEEIR